MDEAKSDENFARLEASERPVVARLAQDLRVTGWLCTELSLSENRGLHLELDHQYANLNATLVIEDPRKKGVLPDDDDAKS